jgi:signal transduction histidine kinase
MAIAWYVKSDYKEALLYNEKALAIRLKFGDDYSKLSSYSKIGTCYHELGKYDEAITYYLKSLKIAEDHDMVQHIGQMSNNIGELFKIQKNYENARTYFKAATDIAVRTNDTIGYARALTNLGVMNENLGNYHQADSIYSLAYKLVQGKKIYDLEGGLLINMGGLYRSQGKTAKGIEYYENAKKLYEKSGELHGLSIVLGNLGNAYLDIGQHKKAFDFYQQSIEVSKSTNSTTRLINSYSIIINYFKVTGDYRQAFYYDSLTDALEDSVFNIEKSRVINELNTRFETEKKEKQIAEQQSEIAQKELESQLRFQLFMGSLSGFVIVILGATIIIRNQRSKQEKLRQQVALEKVEAKNRLQNEKLRISRDLHDNIGSQLTFVISSIDNLGYIKEEEKRKERMAKLADFTRDTMAQLRETIWAINSETISMDRLFSRIAEFVNHAKNAQPGLNFKIGNSGKNFDLTAEQAINLFRTVQEAINNAIKHAEAQNISILASNSALVIEDDGKGFSRKEITHGNGLNNMELRMADVGFRASIESNPGEGTKIRIDF